MMSLSKRRTIGTWFALSALLPAMVAVIAFNAWLDARWHWPFAKRFWTPSPLDDTWVWSTAFAITLALALISRRLTPDEWDGRRDQLNSPIDDETHIARVDAPHDSAPPRANIQRADDATPPRARHSP
jgi:hypothetical protein